MKVIANKIFFGSYGTIICKTIILAYYCKFKMNNTGSINSCYSC